LFEPKQGRHHALNCIAENFATAGVDFIGGPVLPDWSSEPPEWLPKHGYGGVLGIIDHGNRRRRYGSAGFTEMLTGGNTAIRRAKPAGPIRPIACTRRTVTCPRPHPIFPRTCARLRSQGRRQPWRPPLLRL
jgi:hypothetical protein